MERDGRQSVKVNPLGAQVESTWRIYKRWRLSQLIVNIKSSIEAALKGLKKYNIIK